jgi:hypothetical protein
MNRGTYQLCALRLRSAAEYHRTSDQSIDPNQVLDGVNPTLYPASEWSGGSAPSHDGTRTLSLLITPAGIPTMKDPSTPARLTRCLPRTCLARGGRLTAVISRRFHWISARCAFSASPRSSGRRCRSIRVPILYGRPTAGTCTARIPGPGAARGPNLGAGWNCITANQAERCLAGDVQSYIFVGLTQDSEPLIVEQSFTGDMLR